MKESNQNVLRTAMVMHQNVLRTAGVQVSNHNVDRTALEMHKNEIIALANTDNTPKEVLDIYKKNKVSKISHTFSCQ